jgi:hypothetical protein
MMRTPGAGDEGSQNRPANLIDLPLKAGQLMRVKIPSGHPLDVAANKRGIDLHTSVFQDLSVKPFDPRSGRPATRFAHFVVSNVKNSELVDFDRAHVRLRKRSVLSFTFHYT